MSQHLANALIEALDDEYKARATYQYVINTFGAIRPFINIVEAESRHIEALVHLFHKYKIAIPQDTWEQRIDTPESIEAACKAGVAAEIENAEMYEHLLKATADYPDIQRVMKNLQRASAENHLPAFQRCSARFSQQNDDGSTGDCNENNRKGNSRGHRYRGGRCRKAF